MESLKLIQEVWEVGEEEEVLGFILNQNSVTHRRVENCFGIVNHKYPSKFIKIIVNKTLECRR